MDNLEKLKSVTDECDGKILELFKKRMRAEEEAARYKIARGLPLYDPERERDVLYRACSASVGDMQNYVKILFSALTDISRTHIGTLQNEKLPVTDEIGRAIANKKQSFPSAAYVACQGIEGAYSQLAAEALFSAPKIIYLQSFDGVFNAVDKGLCSYGVLPIENSIACSVTEVYELMKKYRFHIARSVKLRVNHVLLAKSGASLRGIKEVYSHDQAISQCSIWLKNNPEIKVTVCENTAVAAMTAAKSGRSDIAALSSANCAAVYNLSVLSPDVQNSDNNYTRFICISKDLQLYREADKMSFMITLDNKAGALYHLLTKFSALGLNLTKLEYLVYRLIFSQRKLQSK